MSLYLMCFYGDKDNGRVVPDRVRSERQEAGYGKSCVRFKKLDDLPLDVIARRSARVPAKAFIERCEEALRGMKRGPRK